MDKKIKPIKEEKSTTKIADCKNEASGRINPISPISLTSWSKPIISKKRLTFSC